MVYTYKKRWRMESIGSRVKAVRKALNLTTTKFGERIGIKNPSVSMIETGKSNPSDRTILSICREFNVNETWLRTGEGEMFTERSRQQEIEKFLSDVANGSDFKRRLVLLLAQMTEDEWALMERMLRKISEEI
nr:MAG TPA: Repressor protein CI [Caudoviricetes sp.]